MRFAVPMFRPLSGAVLLLAVGACTTWEPTTVSPVQMVREESPETVRITASDGTLVRLRHPTVRNDSIVAGGFQSTGIAAQDVRSIEVARFSLKKTLGLAAAGVAAAATWATVAGANSASGGDDGQLPKLTFSLLDGLRLLGGVFR